MGNAYFRFKQFTIRQEHAAMKVSTDSCVFGAWLASLSLTPSHVLDVGTGTGLLTAMLAQAWEARFTAVEIDPSAALEAKQNLQESPWAARMNVLHGDFRTMHFPAKFDLICSNPPFYDQDLKSPADRINLARHSSALQLHELLDTVVRWLEKPGMLALLMPFHRAGETIDKAAERGLFLYRQLNCRQTTGHSLFRSCMLFGHDRPSLPNIESISIQDGQGKYTPEAQRLLSPYYLYL